MTALGFACTGVRSDPYAAGPTLVFRLRITAPADTRVHALALHCQLRIEPGHRPYGDTESGRLTDQFGGRERWAATLHPIRLATVPLLVPGFTGATEIDLVVPCTYDQEVASARYFRALDGGEVPMLLLFSGTAFAGPDGFQVSPVPWDREARVRMPVRVWREAIDRHFPDSGWLRLPDDVIDELLAYRSRRALPSWEATVRELLAAAAIGGTAP
ncbi:DUF6084 family protein [Kitasatospora sp. NPDC001547]|uniref:DUF6084 family protein n=1 Tax=Kitasatospora sp. NPDC001547 TaxID=3364015 RepID=UPI0036BF3680|nr:DUF6084 family protein [Kitasatospora sp. Xyl93]